MHQLWLLFDVDVNIMNVKQVWLDCAVWLTQFVVLP